MKQGSEYANRLKRLLGQLLKKFGKPETVEAVDPIEQLVIGILAGCTTHAKAQAVFKRLRQHVVDLNELRVTPAMELAEQIGDGVPLARQKAQRIVDALNAIRKRQDSLDITFLKQRGRREAREYLEALEGVDRAAAASVVLFGLGGHAFPLDDLIHYVLQKEELVDPEADAAEVQSFLERTINASQAQLSYELLSRHAASKPLKVGFDRLADLVRPASVVEAARKAAVVAAAAAAAAAAAPPVPAKPAPPAGKAVASAAKGAPAPVPGKPGAARPAKPAAPAAKPAQPPGKPVTAPAKGVTPSKGPGAAPGVAPKASGKPDPRKSKPPENRVAVPAPKTAGNHTPVSAKPLARKKK